MIFSYMHWKTDDYPVIVVNSHKLGANWKTSLNKIEW